MAHIIEAIVFYYCCPDLCLQRVPCPVPGAMVRGKDLPMSSPDPRLHRRFMSWPAAVGLYVAFAHTSRVTAMVSICIRIVLVRCTVF